MREEARRQAAQLIIDGDVLYEEQRLVAAAEKYLAAIQLDAYNRFEPANERLGKVRPNIRAFEVKDYEQAKRISPWPTFNNQTAYLLSVSPAKAKGEFVFVGVQVIQNFD